jgi:AraC-like DNA-binding protein
VDWHPFKTTFQEKPPRSLVELRRVFGSSIYFNKPCNSFEIDSNMLGLPLRDADPQLLRIICEQADGLLQNYVATETIESHVRLVIMKELEHGSPSADIVARELGMSLSTLKRRLAERGQNFRSLRDDIVFKLAKRALSETDVSVSQLAMQLGFSEISAFSHAFSRLAGMSPGRYKRESRQII